MSTSSIDDLLSGIKSPQHPETPENQYAEEPEEVEELEPETSEYDTEPEQDSEDEDASHEKSDSSREDNEELAPPEYDEYGNEKERMPKGMKDRLDRKDSQHKREIEQREAEINHLRSQLAQQGASQQVQQAAKDFEFDPEAQGDWQQQLASFVKQTVTSMTRDEQEKQVRAEEAAVQREFEGKLTAGMKKFDDFVDVIQGLGFPIDNPMTLATRAMADPAAFLYAAAKRHPQELERISKLRDPYAKMAEIGKLEERMRRNKPTTKAPRPLSRTHEDAPVPQSKKKSEPSIEDMIAKADAKKLSSMKGRGGRR